MSDHEVFALSASDRQSPLWRRLMGHLEEKVRIARAKNDGPLDAAQTATLRGQIAAYRALIALDKDLPQLD